MKERIALNPNITKEGYTPEISLEDIKRAAERLEPILKETKLIWSGVFSQISGNEVYLKPENLQETGSFKIRGAFYRISLLSKEEKKRGVITASSGNHAQGVAFAAKKAGVWATIVMPKTTPSVKVEATKKYGCEIILHGSCYDEACAKARELKGERGYTFIHPFDDPDVIAGQGTIGLEILDELPEVNTILVPIGGGGLISGIAIAATINPKIKIIGVQPVGADAMHQSIMNKSIIEFESVDTIADGIAVRRPGEITFEIVSNLVDGIMTVTDREISETLRVLYEKQELVCEPAGAVSLSALLSPELNEKGKKIVAIISGGNIDETTLSVIIGK